MHQLQLALLFSEDVELRPLSSLNHVSEDLGFVIWSRTLMHAGNALLRFLES